MFHNAYPDIYLTGYVGGTEFYEWRDTVLEYITMSRRVYTAIDVDCYGRPTYHCMGNGRGRRTHFKRRVRRLLYAFVQYTMHIKKSTQEHA